MANVITRAAAAIGRLFGIGGPKGSGITSQNRAAGMSRSAANRAKVRLPIEKAAKNTRGGASAGGTSGS